MVFPTTLPGLTATNPTNADTLATGPHHTLHTDERVAIDAMAAKLGITNSADTASHDYKLAFFGAVEDSITAHAGGTQASAFALDATKSSHHITVCATAGDSVKLPTLVVGEKHYVFNSGIAACQVYGAGTSTINNLSTASGVSVNPGSGVMFCGISTGKWYTNGLSAGSDHADYTNGFMRNISSGAINFANSTGGYYMAYVPSLDKLFFTEVTANGKLRYIDRVTDCPVDIATYTSKQTRHFIYSTVSGLIYISYGTQTMSVNTTTGVIVTAAIGPGGVMRSDGGFAIRSTTGVIYCASFSLSGVTRIDPVTDTQVGSVVLSSKITGNGPICIAYNPSDDKMYIPANDGTMMVYDCTTDTFSNITTGAFTGSSSTINAVMYSAETNLIYYVCAGTGNTSLKTIAPNGTAIANTYNFPASYTNNFTGGGIFLYEFGGYIYICSQIGTPASIVLIFNKSTSTFVGTIFPYQAGNSFRGFPFAGVLSERVLYIGNGIGGQTGGAAAYYPYRTGYIN